MTNFDHNFAKDSKYILFDNKPYFHLVKRDFKGNKTGTFHV